MRERGVVDVQSLQDDRRAAHELSGDALDPSGAGEGRRLPRDVLGVVAERELLAFLDEAESRIAKAAVRGAALDLFDREEVAEAPLLVARNEEGPFLPVLAEKPVGRYRLDAAL